MERKQNQDSFDALVHFFTLQSEQGLQESRRIRILQSPASLSAFRMDGKRAVASTGVEEAQAVMLADIIRHLAEHGIPEDTIRGAVEIGLRNAKGQADGQ
ncbi:MAG: hypothetical protein ABF449_00690 [Ethanoligenens sp.]